MALAKGKSTVATGPLTLHTKFGIHFLHERILTFLSRTAIWLAEKLTHAKFHIADEDGTTILSCEGISLESSPSLPKD